MAWTALCEFSELHEGAGRYVEIGGFDLAVFLHNGEVFVMDDVCPHVGRSLSGGFVDADGCAVCPWHGWAFKLGTGEIKNTGGQGVQTYKSRLHDFHGKVFVQAELPTF